ncbi:MAG: type II secretory pathway component PulF [Granulosicoccus sp.]|jgi:type II secretory pathway component PulF
MEISHKKLSYKVYCSDIQSSLIAAFFQLSHLLEAGVGVDQSIRELVAMEPRWALRRVWRDIERSVVDGQALSVSMKRWPDVFDSTLIALLRSGEGCGELSSACLDCQQFLEWQQNIKARITTVLLYPVLALVIVFGVLGFLMVYLVPSLEGLLLSSGHEFPWHAQTLLSVSQWIKNYLFYVVVSLCICFLMLCIARVAFSGVRLFADALLLKVPLYGTLILNLTLSRYCETCSRLYGCGIGLADAMEKSEDLVKNRVLHAQLRDTRIDVLSGKSLSVALRAMPLLSNIHIQVLSAGEASGKLAEALARTGNQQRRVSEYRIERIEKMIGPAVLLLAGLSLLWVVLSLLGPIYQNAVDSVILA